MVPYITKFGIGQEVYIIKKIQFGFTVVKRPITAITIRENGIYYQFKNPDDLYPIYIPETLVFSTKQDAINTLAYLQTKETSCVS